MSSARLPRSSRLEICGGGHSRCMLTILLIVVIVLLVFGGFGYSRRGR
ncbi:MAG TPA: hypothetical protein VM143_15160 [Acidimicrobiales bacterium]|nr:hypothetical protein [Acidimicrobiales bacterium]